MNKNVARSARGVGEHWTCNLRVSGSIPGASNLKKLFNWIKISETPHKIITEMRG